MSMTINLVEDHNIYLCEGGPVYNGGVQPTPITYLTQWKIVGNSEVHTDEYLTQWKVEGNSVVDNNTILSCGDLGQDGKYHVKISNGVTIYDIPLTEPLRKVNDVADSIEFADDVATVTRCLYSFKVGNQNWSRYVSGTSGCYRMATSDFNSISKHAPTYNVLTNVIGAIYPSKTGSDLMALKQGVVIAENGAIFIYDPEYNTNANTFKAARAAVEIIFELDTPTTETIQVSPFPISPTDTYTSANDTPYSAFEYKKNVEIWSCGEYSEVDNKWHIRILPEGYGIVDIALDEPLRKVNNVADSIEYADGVATVTRKLKEISLESITWFASTTTKLIITVSVNALIKKPSNNDTRIANVIISDINYDAYPYNTLRNNVEDTSFMGIGVDTSGTVGIANISFYNNSSTPSQVFNDFKVGKVLVYELATPTTETIQVPQIEEADSYTCVISQGAKAVEWSSFETE